jgi:hypothetical protein
MSTIDEQIKAAETIKDSLYANLGAMDELAQQKYKEKPNGIGMYLDPSQLELQMDHIKDSVDLLEEKGRLDAGNLSMIVGMNKQYSDVFIMYDRSTKDKLILVKEDGQKDLHVIFVGNKSR